MLFSREQSLNLSNGGRSNWTPRQHLVATRHNPTEALLRPDDMRSALTKYSETNNAHDPAA